MLCHGDRPDRVIAPQPERGKLAVMPVQIVRKALEGDLLIDAAEQRVIRVCPDILRRVVSDRCLIAAEPRVADKSCLSVIDQLVQDLILRVGTIDGHACHRIAQPLGCPARFCVECAAHLQLIKLVQQIGAERGLLAVRKNRCARVHHGRLQLFVRGFRVFDPRRDKRLRRFDLRGRRFLRNAVHHGTPRRKRGDQHRGKRRYYRLHECTDARPGLLRHGPHRVFQIKLLFHAYRLLWFCL